MSENLNVGPFFAYHKVLVTGPSVDIAVVKKVKEQIEQNKTFAVLTPSAKFTRYILKQVLDEVENSYLTVGSLADGESMTSTLGFCVLDEEKDEIKAIAEFSNYKTIPQNLKGLDTIFLVEPYHIDAERLVEELAARNEITAEIVNVYLIGHNPEYADKNQILTYSDKVQQMREWAGYA